jgi:hypothetical protein
MWKYTEAAPSLSPCRFKPTVSATYSFAASGTHSIAIASQCAEPHLRSRGVLRCRRDLTSPPSRLLCRLCFRVPFASHLPCKKRSQIATRRCAACGRVK